MIKKLLKTPCLPNNVLSDFKSNDVAMLASSERHIQNWELFDVEGHCRCSTPIAIFGVVAERRNNHDHHHQRRCYICKHEVKPFNEKRHVSTDPAPSSDRQHCERAETCHNNVDIGIVFVNVCKTVEPSPHHHLSSSALIAASLSKLLCLLFIKSTALPWGAPLA